MRVYQMNGQQMAGNALEQRPAHPQSFPNTLPARWAGEEALEALHGLQRPQNVVGEMAERSKALC